MQCHSHDRGIAMALPRSCYWAGHVALTVDRCSDDYVTMFHLVDRHALLMPTMQPCSILNARLWGTMTDRIANAKKQFEFEFISQTSNFRTSFNHPEVYTLYGTNQYTETYDVTTYCVCKMIMSCLWLSLCPEVDHVMLLLCQSHPFSKGSPATAVGVKN